MRSRPSGDLAHAGRRLKTKILLGLTLSSVLPLLVIAYLAHAFILPSLPLADTTRAVTVMMLMVFTLVAMAVGGFVIWDLGRNVARLGELLADDRQPQPPRNRRDELGTLMHTMARMRETIEQQASEINSYAARLDAAYRELEATNARLRETSFKDEVTGLYNRRFFSVRLEEEMQRHRRFNHPVSLVLIDLDGFKAVNDALGHVVGDETLREIAQILVKHSRGINVVARYGGDEFVVLLVETARTGARLYADRIRQVISTYPFPHGQPITASFGLAGLPDDDAATGDELVRVADDALYAAKRAGKNQVATTGSPERVG